MNDFLHTRPAEFQAALEYTTADTGFQPALIEKDYFCSLVLRQVAMHEEVPLVFKGGTLLNKAYAGFYRLSEDLDFTISTEEGTPRSMRSRIAKEIENLLAEIIRSIPGLTMVEPLRGHNSSTQYQAVLGYQTVTGTTGTIQFEVSQRELVLLPVEHPELRTILIDAISMEPAVSAFPKRSLAMVEAYAEKVRAALTRRDPAIRDIFDIDYATSAKTLDLSNLELQNLIVQKIRQPGNQLQSTEGLRLEALRQQIETGLRPVLRARDFTAFDFERAVVNLRSLENVVAKILRDQLN
jgi:predicted nucleotidyltransferase component of viral defense system